MLIFHFGVWKMNVCSRRRVLSGQKKLEASLLDSPLWPSACSKLYPAGSQTRRCVAFHTMESYRAQRQAKLSRKLVQMTWTFPLHRWTPTESYVCLLRSRAKWPSQHSRTGSLIGYACFDCSWGLGKPAWGCGLSGDIHLPCLSLSVERAKTDVLQEPCLLRVCSGYSNIYCLKIDSRFLYFFFHFTY